MQRMSTRREAGVLAIGRADGSGQRPPATMGILSILGVLAYFPELIYTSSDRLITIVENNSYEFRVCKILRGTLSVPEFCEYLKIHLCRVQTLASKSPSFQILGTESVPGLRVFLREK